MKNSIEHTADKPQTQETVKIGKTVFIINHIFQPKNTKQETWLTIITRAEGLKAAARA